jgi:O-antigen/teichoic acid export membrane protein
MVYASHGLNGVLGAIAVPVALKMLGVSGYGLLSIYLVIVSYILLADFGVGKNLLRLLAEATDAGTRQTHVRVALGLYILICGAWLALFPLLALLICKYVFPVAAEYEAGLKWMVLLAIAEFAIGIPASLMQTACVAGQRFDAYAKYTFASGLVRNVAILVGVFAFNSPTAVAVILCGRKVADIGLAAVLMGRLPGAWIPIFELQSFRAMLRQSFTLFSAQVTYSTVLSVGSPMVNAVFGLDGLGLYRATFDLAGKIAFVSNGVTLVVFPRVARYFSSEASLPRAESVFSMVTRCSVLFYASFAVVAVLVAPYILPAMGLAGDTTLQLFVLLTIALSINAHSLLINELVQASGRYWYNVLFSLSALLGLMILFWLAIPFTGRNAIGWAWLGAALVASCVADILLVRVCDGAPSRYLKPIGRNILVTAACLVFAAPHCGFLRIGTPIVSAAILAGLFTSFVCAIVPLLRVWSDQKRVSEPLEAAVCA